MSATSSHVETIHTAVEHRLAQAGQRYTTGRRQLVEELAKADQPLAIGRLLERVPRMPVSSAYRHLAVLGASSVVHRLSTGGDEFASYELTDELSGRHHHHVVCEVCGAMGDISAFPRLEKALAEAAEVAAKETGFALDAHRIELIGRCPNCQ